MDDPQTREELLESLETLDPGSSFCFACHPGISCFNHCCADLELELSPYDVLRLRRALGVSSEELFARHLAVQVEGASGLPRVWLRMRGDGLPDQPHPCPFVAETGCTIYGDRPGACRTYPLGRGAIAGAGGDVSVRWVVVREEHCAGFAGGRSWTVADWIADQGLEEYHRSNDRYLALQQRWRQRVAQPSRELTGMAILALFRLDDFRALLYRRSPESLGLDEAGKARVTESDEERLAFAFDWLGRMLEPRPDRPRSLPVVR